MNLVFLELFTSQRCGYLSNLGKRIYALLNRFYYFWILKPQTEMIRIEPIQQDFLKSNPREIQCKIPPLNTYIELVDVRYLKPLHKYVTVNYSFTCRIVASCKWMYCDSKGGTELKMYHIIKTDNGFYFFVEFAEEHKYIRLKNNLKISLNVN